MKIQNFENIKKVWNTYLHNSPYPDDGGYHIKRTFTVYCEPFTVSSPDRYALVTFNKSVIMVEYIQQTGWVLKYWNCEMFFQNRPADYTTSVTDSVMLDKKKFIAYAISMIDTLNT